MTDFEQATEIEEREIARWIDQAGPADPVPEEDIAVLTAEARVAWRQMVERRRSAARDTPQAPDRRPVPRWLPWAAVLVLGVAVVLLWLVGGGGGGGGGGDGGRQAPDGPVEIVRLGQVEVSRGSLTISHPDGTAAGPLTLVAGSSVLTGPDGGATFRLTSGVEVRLADTTRVTFDSAGEIDLALGAVYIDTDASKAGATLAIGTPLGVVRDIGTRFAVRYAGLPGEGDRLEVRVRHGEVEVSTPRDTWRAEAGEALTLGRSGPPERAAVAPHDDAWAWVVAAGPGFEIEGESLASFLVWVERETGWRVRYESPQLAAEADGIELHGDLGELPADQAAFAVLPGAGLEGELAGEGVLLVRTGR